MTVRPFLLLPAAVLAASTTLAADAPSPAAGRVPAAERNAVPMPAARDGEAARAPAARKGKRVRYTFPAPNRVM
jgi:hypothetical protein